MFIPSYLLISGVCMVKNFVGLSIFLEVEDDITIKDFTKISILSVSRGFAWPVTERATIVAFFENLGRGLR